MTDQQKTIFISYRRKVSFGIAGRIHDNLKANGYDVFMDTERLDSGKFDIAILNEIETRAHFLVILEVGSLNRCREEGDWLRREIEHAMDHNRNIVPILVAGFRFDSKKIQRHLTGKLSELPDYNGLRLYHDDFDDKMRRLRERFLKHPVYGPINPIPREEEAVVQEKLEEVEEQPTSSIDNLDSSPSFDQQAFMENFQAFSSRSRRERIAGQPKPKEELSAEEYFERGNDRYNESDFEGAIANYTEAIDLNPHYVVAYNNRGLARAGQGDWNRAIEDYNEAIWLNPQYAHAYFSRGIACHNQGNLAGAIADYTCSIEYNYPELHLPYNNRGVAYEEQGDCQRALEDYNEALRINPQYEAARKNRDKLLKKVLLK